MLRLWFHFATLHLWRCVSLCVCVCCSFFFSRIVVRVVRLTQLTNDVPGVVVFFYIFVGGCCVVALDCYKQSIVCVYFCHRLFSLSFQPDRHGDWKMWKQWQITIRFQRWLFSILSFPKFKCFQHSNANTHHETMRMQMWLMNRFNLPAHFNGIGLLQFQRFVDKRFVVCLFFVSWSFSLFCEKKKSPSLWIQSNGRIKAPIVMMSNDQWFKSKQNHVMTITLYFTPFHVHILCRCVRSYAIVWANKIFAANFLSLSSFFSVSK